jgi:hypothetical protein
MQAMDLVSLSTIERGKVQAFEPTQPYGVVKVHVWSDPESDAPDAIGMLPMTHPNDYRSLHWVLQESELPKRSRVWVKVSPRGEPLGRMRSSIAIAFEEANGVRILKEPQERLTPSARGGRTICSRRSTTACR